MAAFWYCFVPLFVAVDSIGLLPLFIALVEGRDKTAVRRIIVQSILTAIIVGLAFLFVGEAVLRFLGITVSDFLVAGGVILFLIAAKGLFTDPSAQTDTYPEELGPVPIGVPLIVGPGVLTTIMLLAQEYGAAPTAFALVANIVLTGALFLISGRVIAVIGKSGARIMSKIVHLLLAAIAVMMVRRGFMVFLS
ncbi:MAG: MarC family protein [Chitinispirillales bacterium]|jgi:multiple antibiotic resistance protein|nr:MarC family protein [Chitinispirillales bacterium]